MGTRELSPSEWQDYFDGVSKKLVGKQAHVEIMGPDVGSSLAIDWVSIFGITYDPKDDLMDFELDRLNHMINHPKTIAIEEEQGALMSLEIGEGGGRRQLVRFRDIAAIADHWTQAAQMSRASAWRPAF